jgi:chromosome segregation ATPase
MLPGEFCGRCVREGKAAKKAETPKPAPKPVPKLVRKSARDDREIRMYQARMPGGGLGMFRESKEEKQARLDAMKKGLDEREAELAKIQDSIVLRERELNEEAERIDRTKAEIAADWETLGESENPSEEAMNAIKEREVEMAHATADHENHLNELMLRQAEFGDLRRNLTTDRADYEAKVKLFHAKYDSVEERNEARRARARARSEANMHKGTKTGSGGIEGQGTSRKAKQAAKKRKLTGGTGRSKG